MANDIVNDYENIHASYNENVLDERQFNVNSKTIEQNLPENFNRMIGVEPTSSFDNAFELFRDMPQLNSKKNKYINETISKKVINSINTLTNKLIIFNQYKYSNSFSCSTIYIVILLLCLGYNKQLSIRDVNVDELVILHNNIIKSKMYYVKSDLFVGNYKNIRNVSVLKKIIHFNKCNGDTTFLNNIYFKSKWQHQFKLIGNGMMATNGHFNYYSGKRYKSVELPFNDKSIVFGIIMQNNNSEMIVPPTSEVLLNNVEKMQNESCCIVMPKFMVEFEHQLNELLEYIGIKCINIVQQIHFEIDEEGSIPYNDEVGKIIFSAEKPFMYYIRDVKLNCLIISGIWRR